MPLPSSTELSLQRVFYEGFVARDIAEPLASFDDTTDIETVRDFLMQRPLSVVGVRRNGLVTGFVEQHELDDRPLAEQNRPLKAAAIVNTSATFQDVILQLDDHSFMLVEVMGQPVGLIVRDDLQKAPVRMWLFGMVTLIEMRLTRIIKELCPDESWQQLLSPARITKAEQLRVERQRRNQNIDLVDCLQFGDKGQMFARSPELRITIRLESRGQVERAVRNLEKLRNSLAHGQDIVSESWDVIVSLARDLDGIIGVGRPE